jgi:hypothetical protein
MPDSQEIAGKWEELMKLNDIQRIIIIVGVLLILICFLCPPWVERYHGDNLRFLGYNWLWSPPLHVGFVGIATDYLLIQIGVLLLATVGLAFATKRA